METLPGRRELEWQRALLLAGGLVLLQVVLAAGVLSGVVGEGQITTRLLNLPHAAALLVLFVSFVRSSSADRTGLGALVALLAIWEMARWLEPSGLSPMASGGYAAPAAALVLIGYAFAFAAVLQLTPPSATADAKQALEVSAVIVIVSAALIQYVAPIESTLAREHVLGTAFAVLDALLLVIVVISLFSDQSENPVRGTLLAASFLTMFALNATTLAGWSQGGAQAALVSQGSHFAIWPLVFAGLVRPAHGLRYRIDDNRIISFAQSAFPFLVVAPAAIAVVGHSLAGEAVPALTIGTFLAAILLLGRQWLVAAENRGLYAHREELLAAFNAKTAELEREIVERRRAETALRRTEERFRAVAENLDEGLLLANQSGRIVYANPRMAQLAGYDRSEFLGRRARDVLDPWEEWKTLIELVGASEGTSVRREIPSVTLEGKQVWLEAYARSFHPGGDDATVIAIAIDVTERKLAEEEAVRRANDLSRYNEALERLSSSTAFSSGGLRAAAAEIAEVGATTLGLDALSIWLVDASTGQLRLFTRHPNQRAEDPTLELHPDPDLRYLERLNSEGSLDIRRDSDTPERAAMARAILPSPGVNIALDIPVRLLGETVAVIRCERSDPSHEWTASEHSVCVSLAGFMATALETDKRQEALNRAARLAAVLSATPDMVAMFGAGGHAFFINNSARQVLGIAPEADISSVRIEAFHPADALQLLTGKALPAARAAGAWAGETTVQAADGRLIPVSQVILCHEDEGGMRYVATVMRDLTETRRAAEERERLNRKLQEAHKLESLGLLAGGVAHDFNNLLQAMLGNAQVARMAISPDIAIAHESLEELETAASRAGDLVKQLLAFAGSGQQGVSPTDPSSLVEETVRLLLAVVTRHATINLSLDPELPPVEADPVQLRQMVMNLVTNAADAIGPRGGAIDVRTRTIRATPEFLRECFLGEGLTPGEYVAIEVKDTGSGMDKDTVARIFDPFFTTKSYGHGLGLAAVLGTVRSHGGALRVDSCPGRGTTFTVLLPPLVKKRRRRRHAA